MSPAPHACVDCLALPESERPSRARPAPHGAGRSRRCVTHKRAHDNAAKARKRDYDRERRHGGMTPEVRAELVAFQNGMCPICLRSVEDDPKSKRKPATDHDHECCPTSPTCGECTRGITCNYCNYSLLGRFDLAALRRAVAYLEDPPMARMRRARLETAS